MPVAQNDNRGAQVTSLGSFLAYIDAYDVSLMATGGAGTAASPWTGWETELNAVPQNSRIHFPTGYYTQASIITMKAGWTISGDGKLATQIRSTIAGTAFRTAFTFNQTNIAHLFIHDLAIINTNASNTGSGILECAGTYVNLARIKISGFKAGVVLNQTQLADLDGLDIEAQITMGLWLVNGNDYKAANGWDLDLSSATSGFTNRIAVHDCQFNNQGNTTVYGIADDGGLNHDLFDNNFNGGATGIRVAGTTSARIAVSDFETTASRCVWSTNTSFYGGGGVGANSCLQIESNRMIPNAGQNAITVTAGTPLLLLNNTYSTTVVAVTGLANAAAVVALGGQQVGAGALYDSRATMMLDSSVVQRHAKAYATTNQTIPDSALTAINLDSEVYDSGGYHSTSSNTSRMVVPTDGGVGAGIHMIHGTLTFAANATGVRMASIRKNGATYLGHQRVTNAGGALTNPIQVAAFDQPAVSDYYELVGFQNSGGDLATVGTLDQVNLSITRIH